MLPFRVENAAFISMKSIGGKVPDSICRLSEFGATIRLDCALDCSVECCGTQCFNPRDNRCEKDEQYVWYSQDDITSSTTTARSSSTFLTCDWLELNDDQGCPIYRDLFHDKSAISAGDACCYCGTCEDLDGWNFEGDTCSDMYEKEDEPGCPKFGWHSSPEDISAWDACCYCGGGSIDVISDNQMEFSPVQSPTNKNLGTVASCVDVEGWISVAYETSETCQSLYEWDGCLEKGYVLFDINFMYAAEACCCFGGGVKQSVPTHAPVDKLTGNCKDIQIPRPWPKMNCDWFSLDSSRCVDYGNEVILRVNGEDMTANDVCCSCGGGSTYCQDFPGWFDSFDTHPYSCRDYDERDQCGFDGDTYFNFGHNANTACCICGESRTVLVS